MQVAILPECLRRYTESTCSHERHLMKAITRAALAWTLLAVAGTPTLAQRTDDNVTAQSDDAFGRSVGNESIGIYNGDEVRGFSPIDAGNVRIEGLYFDQQGDPTQRLVDGSSIRVGIAAQNYPFPSPTGIVDYELRHVGKKQVVSAVLSYGPFDSTGVEVDAQLPIAGERFGIGLGAGRYHDNFDWGGGNRAISYAIIPEWRPTENIELRPFFSGITFHDEETQPLMLMSGDLLPPKIPRNHFYGQRWAQNEGELLTYGLISQARLGEWVTSLGVFESVFAPSAEFAELFVDVDANGIGNERIIAFPDSRYASTSGELRAARTFGAGIRRHTLFLTLRARDQQRRYGGDQEIDAGPVTLGVGRPIAKPEFSFGVQSRDEVRQQTAGIAYELEWKDRGELSVGVQKTSYSKSVETPLGALPETDADPLLEYATATFHATPWLAVYGGYTEGLEESPVAPDNAVNRNVAAPALRTEQYDAGVRIALPAQLKLIAGVFNVEKPYFDLDPADRFTQLGTVQHRGVELSLAGTPLEGLTLVAGTRFLDASVSGQTLNAGVIGTKPVGTAKNYSIVSIDYTLSGTGVSLDTMFESISAQVANTSNTLEVPGRMVMHLGGRYRFELFGKPATLRAQVSNIFDRYGWSVVSGGAYVYNSPRRFSVNLAADL
jgi:iron complex outermembrane receptor protein